MGGRPETYLEDSAESSSFLVLVLRTVTCIRNKPCSFDKLDVSLFYFESGLSDFKLTSRYFFTISRCVIEVAWSQMSVSRLELFLSFLGLHFSFPSLVFLLKTFVLLSLHLTSNWFQLIKKKLDELSLEKPWYNYQEKTSH